MNKTVLISLGLLCAVAAGIAGFQLYKTQQSRAVTDGQPPMLQPDNTGVQIGNLRPDFSLPDKEGVMHSVKEWDNNVLVINFWATWCPPCREEIPEFIKLQNKYANQGLQFIGIALQTAEEVQDFVAELGMNYPVLVGLEDVIRVAEQYGNQSGVLPYTVIIDRQQRITFIKRGPLKYEEVEARIAPLL